ncbi:MAG TPA: MarR family winged helix-turn-helix transcriptional regulator [Pseudonocardiaceae bacterium]|jgi:DNA-binding MarR family transcriptional regulator|nr:MarR family winged helix-turn-helix transcriptional regulator [Pseudonocardiaceae bacterium]
MYDNTDDDSVANSVTYQLLRLGQVANHRFVDQLAPLGLRPRHCAVLELLRGGPMPQLELAHCLGVAPSVVVDMIDELQDLHAVARVRSAQDRRRQFVELTPHGRGLVRRAANAARALDADLLRDLDTDQCAGLRAGLHQIVSEHGHKRQGEVSAASAAS